MVAELPNLIGVESRTAFDEIYLVLLHEHMDASRSFTQRRTTSGNKKKLRPRNELASADSTPGPATVGQVTSTESVELTAVDGNPLDVDGDLCFICAEPIKCHSVASCNHRTCHICALRLRALYNKFDCTFCKVGYIPCLFVNSFIRGLGPPDVRDIYRFSRCNL